MKALITRIAFLLFLSANIAYGQDYSFKVLANKGDNEIYPKSAEAIWEPLKTGAVLMDGDKIKVGENAYVGLMHKSGRTIELKVEGEYNISELVKTQSGSTGIASIYADFIMNKMSNAGTEEDINKNHREHLKVTGAVERSVLADINVMMPTSAEVLNTHALIKWDNVAPEAGYLITFTNMFDEVIATKQTESPFFNVNLNDPKFSKEKLLIFNVKVVGDESKSSENYGIKRMSADEATPIKNDLAALKAELQEETAMNKLILASFYEQHDLLVDALTNYEEAISLYPEVKEFEIAYQQFKDRNGLMN